jgi:hypothetical protein
MSKTKDTQIERTPAAIQADIDQLQVRYDELGASIREARRTPKFTDFLTLGGKESEHNHISNSQLPALHAELKAAQLAEAMREFAELDAQRAGLQAESAAANLAVQAAQQAVDASAMARGSERVDASFYRRRGAAFIALADSMDAAKGPNERSNALELRVIAMRKTLAEAGVM